MCLSKKHILFISSSSVISAASPHSIMSSQEAESPTMDWFEIILTQFYLFMQTAHAVKNIHFHTIGGFVCLWVFGSRHLTNCNRFLCALPFLIICCKSWTGRPQRQLLLIWSMLLARLHHASTTEPDSITQKCNLPGFTRDGWELGTLADITAGLCHAPSLLEIGKEKK